MIDLSHPAISVLDSSKLQDFMRCPRRAFFRHILGWDLEQDNVHLVFGSAWHKAMECLVATGYTEEGVVEAFTAFLDIYRASFTEEMDEVNAPKSPANALRALFLYTQKWPNDLANLEVLHVECAGTVLIPGDHELVYKMDLIARDRNTHAIEALERKTTKSLSSAWGNQWRQKFQLGTYSYVLHCLYPDEAEVSITVDGVQIVDPPKTARGTKDIDFLRIPIRWSIDKIEDWLQTATFYYEWWLSELDVLSRCTDSTNVLPCFPKNVEACSDYFGCPFLDHCSAISNPLRIVGSPPPGCQIRYWNPLEELSTASEVIELQKGPSA